MGEWSGRTALVTGASRGIGRAVALALAGEGCATALLGRDEAALRETADACAAVGPTPLSFVVDVTDAAGVTAAVAEALAAFGGRLDLLANVAGSSLRQARLEELDDADWEEQFALHVLAPARLQRLCRPALAAAGGAVVNVSSIAASRAAPLGAAYAAAKAGVEALTRATALEWARDGIRAVAVKPGYTDTAFNDRLVAAGLQDRLLARVPTRRSIAAEEIARAILFAGSPGSPSLNGAMITVDGGWSARL